ncbi:MAG: EamA family transporter [Nocardioides sp.]
MISTIDPERTLVQTTDLALGKHRRGVNQAIALVLVGTASVQVGAAVGKGAFDSIAPTSLTWLRLVASAALMLAWARPSLRGHSRADWLVASGFGFTLAVMNWAIYQSFARIPIGVAVTIEFVGPLAVAVVGSRRARDVLWVLLAGTGVALLGFSPTDLNLAGVGVALLAGVCWAAYIMLSAHTGRRWSGLDGLAVASALAAGLLTPMAVGAGGAALAEPQILAIGLAIGLLSSAIPYSLEITALRTLPPALFGILMSLEPAVAALAAGLILGELLTLSQWVAMVCVMVASIGATRSQSRAGPATSGPALG